MATVSIIGYGRMGKLHAETWAGMGHEIVEIFDGDGEPAYHGQIASIASPDWMHGEQVLEALKRGKDVFVEKPLCTTADQLSKIKHAKRPEQKVSVNLPLRLHPPFAELASVNAGTIYQIEAEYNWGRLKNMAGWRLDPRYSIIHGGGIHMVDLMIWLTGKIPAWSSGLGQNAVLPEFDGAMNVQGLGYFRGGPMVRLGIDFSFNGSHTHVLRVLGTEGAYEVRNFEKVDKTVCLKLFDQDWTNYEEAVQATNSCLSLEAICSRK